MFSRNQDSPYVISAAQVDLFDETRLINVSSLPKEFNNSGETPATTAENVFDHYSGNSDAKVTVIEYGDFSCSHCTQYNPILEVAREKYQDDVVFIYRYFLLGSAYVNSTAATAAAEAAARQDKFWEMHNILYENQSAWSNVGADVRKSVFQGYAEEVGVDVERWSEDYDSYQTNGIKTKIDFDVALARKIGIAGTPTLMINGYKLDPQANPDDAWTTQDKLNAIIEKYITKSKEN